MLQRAFQRRGSWWVAIFFICCLVRSWLTAAESGITPNLAEFKAAVFSKLPGYVSWEKSPPETVERRSFTVLILGNQEGMYQKVLELLQGSRLRGLQVEVRHLPELPENLPPCHVLFVGGELHAEWGKSSQQYNLTGVLTVGEHDSFLSENGIIRLNPVDRRIHVRLGNAQSAGIVISSRLLRVAQVER